jgi:lipoprotein-releasing system ATP-binding protein
VHERGKTVIAVTHDVDLAARMDRRIHLVDGAMTSDERNGG